MIVTLLVIKLCSGVTTEYDTFGVGIFDGVLRFTETRLGVWTVHNIPMSEIESMESGVYVNSNINR